MQASFHPIPSMLLDFVVLVAGLMCVLSFPVNFLSGWHALSLRFRARIGAIRRRQIRRTFFL